MDPDDVVTAEGFKATVGAASMDVMDAIDEEVMELVGRVDRVIGKLTRLLVEKGLDETHAIQMSVSFATGAAVDTLR